MTVFCFRQASGIKTVPEEAKLPKGKCFLRHGPGSIFPLSGSFRRFLRRWAIKLQVA